jgi:hypothetical protein
MNPKLFNDVLNEEMAMQVARAFGVENESPAVRATVLAELGTNISRRIALDILRALPEEKRGAFEELIGTDKLDDMYTLIKPYIKDLDAFVQTSARHEIDETLALIATPETPQYV